MEWLRFTRVVHALHPHSDNLVYNSWMKKFHWSLHTTTADARVVVHGKSNKIPLASTVNADYFLPSVMDDAFNEV